LFEVKEVYLQVPELGVLGGDPQSVLYWVQPVFAFLKDGQKEQPVVQDFWSSEIQFLW
jgi:hypothetical protein